jgi:lipopolysaccharide biosynthesis glycosyltransferase
MNKFDVVYSLDSNYLIPFCTSLHSLLEHNLHLVNQIYLLHDEKSSKSREYAKITKHISAAFDKKIKGIVIDEKNFGKLRSDRHISPATYYRLKVGELLPAETHAVLSIDCDTIVTEELSEVANAEFDDHDETLAYAVDHQFRQVPKRVLKFAPLQSYFNAGVILFNLRGFRAEFDSQALIDFGEQHKKDMKLWDQDILNIHFNNRWKPLPAGYNAFEKLQYSIQRPVIIHYTGNRKPWHLICHSPLKMDYWRVLKKTPFWTSLFQVRYFFSITITFVWRQVRNLSR